MEMLLKALGIHNTYQISTHPMCVIHLEDTIVELIKGLVRNKF